MLRILSSHERMTLLTFSRSYGHDLLFFEHFSLYFTGFLYLFYDCRFLVSLLVVSLLLPLSLFLLLLTLAIPFKPL